MMRLRRGLDSAKVVAAGATLADERGWNELSLAELAARCRVKPPSLYNHVASLAALRREIALAALRDLRARLSDAAVGRSRDDAVRSLAKAHRDFVKAHPGTYQATIAAPDPADKELTRAGDAVVEVCLAVLRGYGMSRRRALHALRSLRSAVHGFATLEIGSGFGLPLDLDQSFAWMIDSLITSMKSADPAVKG